MVDAITKAALDKLQITISSMIDTTLSSSASLYEGTEHWISSSSLVSADGSTSLIVPAAPLKPMSARRAAWLAFRDPSLLEKPRTRVTNHCKHPRCMNPWHAHIGYQSNPVNTFDSASVPNASQIVSETTKKAALKMAESINTVLVSKYVVDSAKVEPITTDAVNIALKNIASKAFKKPLSQQYGKSPVVKTPKPAVEAQHFDSYDEWPWSS